MSKQQNYLVYNMELLVYSSGYTIRKFGKQLHMSWDFHAYNPNVFAERYDKRIEEFIVSQEENWLYSLYTECKKRVVPKVDGCIFENDWRPDCFGKNLSKLGYFLDVSWTDLAEKLYISSTNLVRMREMPHLYDEGRWAEVYNALNHYYADTYEKKELLRKSTNHLILNKIPKNAFNRPRKNYMAYNETQDNI